MTTDRHLDRTGWPSGPWDDEPDRIEWRYRGLPCLIVRNNLGALCGYVGVAPGHPWHGKQYDDVPADTHGGLTYSRSCEDSPHICHVPEPGEPDSVWWLGFDCNHGGDNAPLVMALDAELERKHPELKAYRETLSESLYQYFRGSYKPVAYVTAEVEQLADQALEASHGALSRGGSNPWAENVVRISAGSPAGGGRK